MCGHPRPYAHDDSEQKNAWIKMVWHPNSSTRLPFLGCYKRLCVDSQVGSASGGKSNQPEETDESQPRGMGPFVPAAAP